MYVRFSGKFADVRRDADKWAQEHPDLNERATWTIIVEYEETTGDIGYFCPVARRNVRGVAASPEQTRVRVVGPCCYATIQDAVDVSNEGDTILIIEEGPCQTSESCYAVVICQACTKVHVVDKIAGSATTIDQHSQVQVVGHRK